MLNDYTFLFLSALSVLRSFVHANPTENTPWFDPSDNTACHGCTRMDGGKTVDLFNRLMRDVTPSQGLLLHLPDYSKLKLFLELLFL